MAQLNILNKIYAAGPLILLYYLSISDVDANLENFLEIFSINLQLIIIYFWMIKRPTLMGTGHVFVAGFINDVVIDDDNNAIEKFTKNKVVKVFVVLFRRQRFEEFRVFFCNFLKFIMISYHHYHFQQAHERLVPSPPGAIIHFTKEFPVALSSL